MHKKLTTIVIPTFAILASAYFFPIQAKNISNSPGAVSGNIEIPFIVNQGQVDDRIIGSAQTLGGKVYIEKNGKIVYSLNGDDQRSFILKENADKAVCNVITFEDKAPTKINYFKGSDRSYWRSNIPSYNVINLGELYDGITLKLKAYGNNIEKLFYIAPGADPNDIKMKIDKAENLCVNNSGELEVLTEYGSVLFTKPTAYQNIKGIKKFIDVEYRTEVDAYGFSVGNYDRDFELIIDPLLASTYLGGSDIEGWEYSGVIDDATDSEGNILVAGMTESVDFPYMEGHYECDTRGNTDLFIAKFDENLAELLTVTVIGGSADERYPRITVGGNGNIYLLGQSFSSNYPTTAEAFSQSYSGNGDIVISRFDQELTTLMASTYIGGAGYEDFPALDMDNSDNVFISGVTSHDSYPTIEGSYRTYIVGSNEYFISKLSPDLSTLIASTFIGGQYQERHTGMTIAASGEVVLTGTTASPDYPTTAGAFDTTFNGLPPYSEYNNDAVVSKFDNGLTTLLASTFIGAEDYEGGIIIAIDTSGSIFFGGHTTSADYPTTPGAFDEGHNGINEFFITKMSSDLTAMEASTLLTPDKPGINGFIFINDLFFDGRNQLIMVGSAWDNYLYTTENAYDRSFNGGSNDLGIMVMSDDLTMVKYATYLGGTGNEGDAAVTGGIGEYFHISCYSSSTDFPIIAGAWQPAHAGGEMDCVVARLTFNQFTRITDGPHVDTIGENNSVSWIDYDNDTYPDLFLSNHMGLNQLYKNNCDGTFSIPVGNIILNDGYSVSSCWADLDNDGDLDAYVGNGMHVGVTNFYYVNNGDGTFTKNTDDIIANVLSSSLDGVCDDYNNDGNLDIFNASDMFDGNSYDQLYRGNGDGTFELITDCPMAVDASASAFAIWLDIDDDRDADLLMSKDPYETLYLNDGGEFTVVTDSNFLTVSWNMGYCAGDYDNDGDLDLYVQTWNGQNSALFMNNGNGAFEEITDQAMNNDSLWSIGSCAGDFDNDGDLDIYVANDYYETDQPDYFYINDGNGVFTPYIDSAMIDNPSSFSCKAVCADYDRDGDLDIYAINWYPDYTNCLFQNNGNSNGWITIKPIGMQSSRSALGTKIRIFANINSQPIWQMREIRSHNSPRSQNPLEAHFGLGDADIIDSIIIEWPSGMVDVYTDISPNQFITYTETVCGDADGNLNVNLLDITYLISYLYKGGPDPHNMQAADPDGNGTTNLLDITYLIAYLYKGGTKPVC